jgi:anti-anti-sigma factor
MATQITQIDLPDKRKTILRVEGDMLHEDAVVLEKLANCIIDESGNTIVIDLADLDFLDSEAASILKRLEDDKGCEIEGVEIFLQSAVDMAERAASNT